jgi:hypothetical protein
MLAGLRPLPPVMAVLVTAIHVLAAMESLETPANRVAAASPCLRRA